MALDYITELPDECLLESIKHIGPDESQSRVRDEASFAATCTRVCRLYREKIQPNRILLRDKQDDIITYSVKERILKFHDFSEERVNFRIFGRIGWSGNRNLWQDANWRPPGYSPDKWAVFLESAKSNLRRWTFGDHLEEIKRTYYIKSNQPNPPGPQRQLVTHEDIMLFHKAAMNKARSIRRRQLRLARKNATIAVA